MSEATEEKCWYFAKGGKPYGPCTLHEMSDHFEKGSFARTDFVHCKGKTEGWVKAETITGLCDSLALDPEPEPEHHSVPLYERAAYDHAAGKEKVKKQKVKRAKAFWSRLKKTDK